MADKRAYQVCVMVIDTMHSWHFETYVAPCHLGSYGSRDAAILQAQRNNPTLKPNRFVLSKMNRTSKDGCRPDSVY